MCRTLKTDELVLHEDRQPMTVLLEARGEGAAIHDRHADWAGPVPFGRGWHRGC